MLDGMEISTRAGILAAARGTDPVDRPAARIQCLVHGLRFMTPAQPRGLFGRIYWYSLLPIHAAIFKRMAQKIVEAATRRPSSGDVPTGPVLS